MKISHMPGDEVAWICLCGNTVSGYGFYPCNTQGEIVEPTPQEWTTDWYVCDQCGRIIDEATLEVVGRRKS
jgi:hypothetical protein